MSGSGNILEYQMQLTAQLEQVMRERDEARAEVARLREALEQYGVHDDECAAYRSHSKCRCGLDAAISGEQSMCGRANLCEQCEDLPTLCVTVQDLKDRLRAARAALDNFSDAEHGVGLCGSPKCLLCSGWYATSLRTKNWRKS